MKIAADEDNPCFYQDALESLNLKESTLEMNDEINSIHKNYVWDLVDLPKEQKTISNEWVLKMKQKANRSNDKFKARRVAKGSH